MKNLRSISFVISVFPPWVSPFSFEEEKDTTGHRCAVEYFLAAWLSHRIMKMYMNVVLKYEIILCSYLHSWHISVILKHVFELRGTLSGSRMASRHVVCLTFHFFLNVDDRGWNKIYAMKYFYILKNCMLWHCLTLSSCFFFSFLFFSSNCTLKGLLLIEIHIFNSRL